jgi:hypothetical protein
MFFPQGGQRRRGEDQITQPFELYDKDRFHPDFTTEQTSPHLPPLASSAKDPEVRRKQTTNGRENKRAHPTAEERRLIFVNPLTDFGALYLPASESWFLFVFIRVHSQLVFTPGALCLSAMKTSSLL